MIVYLKTTVPFTQKPSKR